MIHKFINSQILFLPTSRRNHEIADEDLQAGRCRVFKKKIVIVTVRSTLSPPRLNNTFWNGELGQYWMQQSKANTPIRINRENPR